MSASATIVSFLPIESCRLESLPKDTILLNTTEVLKILVYFRSDIASENWDALDNFQDPNNMWREWKIKFLNVVDTRAPLRTKRVRSKRSPWITSELKKRVHERDIMKLKAIRSKNPQDWGEFKRLRNKFNSDIRIVKESYYKQSFTENKNDSRSTWQTMNELTSRKSNTPSIKELIVTGVSINKSIACERRRISGGRFSPPKSSYFSGERNDRWKYVCVRRLINLLTWQMRLMNIFPQLARSFLIRSRRQLTVTKVVLNILISLTKDSVLLRQIAVKYFYY